jgi:tetratricopeptide (TPR) repeat protein
LYILEKDYIAAVDLLLKGLLLAEHDAEKYALHKNLGWARLGQGRYAEAKAELMAAIDLDKEQAPAYGLLAQALEALGEKEDALVAWENCLRYASSYRPDEDTWIGLARLRLAAIG